MQLAVISESTVLFHQLMFTPENKLFDTGMELVPGDNGSSICSSSSCAESIADPPLLLLPAQTMLVLLKLGVPTNWLPPEPVVIVTGYFHESMAASLYLESTVKFID